MKKVLFLIFMIGFLFMPVSALTVTFCPRYWIWELYQQGYFCGCNTGAGCVDYDWSTPHMFDEPGPGNAMPGARTVLYDNRYGTVLNQSQHGGQCVSYNAAVEGSYIVAKVYNISAYKWGGQWWDEQDPSCSITYMPAGAGQVYYAEYGRDGGCSYSESEKAFICYLSTFETSTTYIAHFADMNVTWRMTMTNAITGQPIDNLWISVQGVYNYTDSSGVSYHQYINPFKDVAIFYGGTRPGDYTGESWNLNANNDNPFDISIYGDFIYIGNNDGGSVSNNATVMVYWKNNGTYHSTPINFGECTTGIRSYGGLAVDGVFLYRGIDCDNRLGRNNRTNSYTNWTDTTSFYSSSVSEWTDIHGMDTTFPPLSNGTTDANYFLWVNDIYDKLVYRYFAINGTYTNYYLNYSDHVSANTYVTGISINNIYAWLVTYSESIGITEVLQYGLDGNYVGFWRADIDQFIKPVGIDTDGTHFWIVTENGEVRRYWRVGNSSEGYYPMSQTLYTNEYGIITFPNSDVECLPHGHGTCESLCGLQFSAPPIDEDVNYYWVYVYDEDNEYVNNAYLTFTADQDPGVSKTTLTYYDGFTQGAIYGRVGWTYTVTITGGNIERYQESGFTFDNLTLDGGTAVFNYLNFTVKRDETVECSEKYFEDGDIKWSNGTVYRNLDITCETPGGLEYWCNPGFRDGTDCYMGKEIHCLSDCSISVVDAWACEYGYNTQASAYLPPETCSDTYYQGAGSDENVGDMSMTEIALLGWTGFTGNNPDAGMVLGLLALTVVPVAAVAYTGVMAVGMMAFVSLVALLTFLGIIPGVLIFILGAVIIGYFFVTLFLNKGKGDRD